MNQTTTNTFIKYAISIGLAIIPFIPLYVANSLFFPFITGKAFAFRIVVEIIFALWLILVLRERGTSMAGSERSVVPRINSMTIFVTSFTIVVLIADIFGVNPLRSVWSNFERMEGWMTIIHLWAYFIVLSSVLGSGEEAKGNWKIFFNLILGAGFVVAIYGLFQFFGRAAIHQGSSRVDASLGNSAYMAVYMLINAFIAGYMAFSVGSYKKFLIWLYSVLFILFSFVMFQTATRGTILGWVAGILIACAIYAIFEKRQESKKLKWSATGVIALFVIVGGLFWMNRDAEWIKKNSVLGRLATISISDTKTQARGFIWPMAIKGTFSSPKTAIIGWGQENFNYLFNANYNPKMWMHEQWFDRAHSVFLDWLVASGLLGIGLYLTLYVLSLIYIWKSDLNLGQKSMLIALIVSYGIHNIFVFDNQTSYVMFFTVLAFLHSLKFGKVYKWFGGYSSIEPSENAIVVRDYVFVPVIIIAFVATLYFINVRPIQANTDLIQAVSACSNASTATISPFEKALKLDQSVANQEIREQLFSCASNVIRNNLPEKTKESFYDLTKKEGDKQVATTPKDARIYIIAGGFYNSIGDWNAARPYLEKAAELSPGKQSIIFELVINYLNSGKGKEAADLMEKAYTSAPDNPTSKIGYAVALITAGEEKRAKELFADSSELFTDPRVVNAYIAQKQYDKAIEIYKQLIAKTPDDPQIYSALASTYLMAKQNYLAVQTLKTAQQKFPDLKVQIDTIIKQIESGKM